MGIVSYEIFKEIEPKWKNRMVAISFFYTLVLLALLIEVVSSLFSDEKSLNCQDFTKVQYTTSSDGVLTFYTSETNLTLASAVTESYVCNDAKDTPGQYRQINGIVTFSSICIFLCYLCYKTIEIDKGKALSKLLKDDGDLLSARAIRNIMGLDSIQLAMVEIAGIVFIFFSKSATEMLLNSSATIFLSEVDGLLIEMVMTSVAKYYGLSVELDFAGVSFQGVLKDGSKDEKTAAKDASGKTGEEIANTENPMNRSSLNDSNKSAVENKIKAKKEAKKGAKKNSDIV